MYLIGRIMYIAMLFFITGCESAMHIEWFYHTFSAIIVY